MWSLLDKGKLAGAHLPPPQVLSHVGHYNALLPVLGFHYCFSAWCAVATSGHFCRVGISAPVPARPPPQTSPHPHSSHFSKDLGQSSGLLFPYLTTRPWLPGPEGPAKCQLDGRAEVAPPPSNPELLFQPCRGPCPASPTWVMSEIRESQPRLPRRTAPGCQPGSAKRGLPGRRIRALRPQGLPFGGVLQHRHRDSLLRGTGGQERGRGCVPGAPRPLPCPRLPARARADGLASPPWKPGSPGGEAVPPGPEGRSLERRLHLLKDQITPGVRTLRPNLLEGLGRDCPGCPAPRQEGCPRATQKHVPGPRGRRSRGAAAPSLPPPAAASQSAPRPAGASQANPPHLSRTGRNARLPLSRERKTESREGRGLPQVATQLLSCQLCCSYSAIPPPFPVPRTQLVHNKCRHIPLLVIPGVEEIAWAKLFGPAPEPCAIQPLSSFSFPTSDPGSGRTAGMLPPRSPPPPPPRQPSPALGTAFSSPCSHTPSSPTLSSHLFSLLGVGHGRDLLRGAGLRFPGALENPPQQGWGLLPCAVPPGA
ncbi:uncharacterized protein LOC141544698 [Sminthopsis crassicaudata]|uniref:uncharacterized protein LOC141544698 n=1 Tax=Sminthopsis crassicaudata TaxID=9301 RepID=UPI003D6940AF